MAIFNTVQLTKLCKNRCPIQQDTLPCLDSGQVDEIAFMVQFQTYELKWALKSRQQFKLCAAKKGKEMREAKKRKFHAPEFKAKVGLEALGARLRQQFCRTPGFQEFPCFRQRTPLVIHCILI